ncbi:MAG: universal stress protein [Bacteroidales bacterium]|nr:universal stress protein [Bacteroidales bacterium]
MKNIIVPLDFSDDSLNGLDFAIIIAEKLKANIYMIFVQRKRSSFQTFSKDDEYNYAKDKFENILETYKNKISTDIKIEYVIKSGKIYKEVVDFTSEVQEPLIITATHGSSGFEETFVGSNALKIVSYSNCPVVLVRNGIFPKSINKIVMPLDMSVATKEKVPATIEIAKAFDSEIFLVDIAAKKGHDIRFRMNLDSHEVSHYLNKQKIPHQTELLIGPNIANVIIEHVKKLNADLIVGVSEHDKKVSSLIGPNALQLIHKTPVPILIIPSDEEMKK